MIYKRYLQEILYLYQYSMDDNYLFPSPGLTNLLKQLLTTSNDENSHSSGRKKIKNPTNIFSLLPLSHKDNQQHSNLRKFSAQKFTIAIRNIQQIQTLERTEETEHEEGKDCQDREKIRKAKIELFMSEDTLHSKDTLSKKSEEPLPLIFIKGKINLEVNYEEEMARLHLHKITNHSYETFYNLSCIVIATTQKIQKNDFYLSPSDYELVMADYILQPLNPHSSITEISIEAEWKQPSPGYLSVLLRNEENGKILFCTHCYGMKELVHKAIGKSKGEKIY